MKISGFMLLSRTLIWIFEIQTTAARNTNTSAYDAAWLATNSAAM